MEETVPSVEAYEAAMVLSGVGDALGYRGARWEYCTSGAQIHAELAELGGLEAITLEPPEWPVSDDTILHLATAEGLATGLEDELLLQELAHRYVTAMGDMEGRKPGPTSILGYLGALAVALFGALGARGEPPECWGAELMRVLPLAWDYVESAGVAVADNAAAWPFFGDVWHRYLESRKLLEGHSPPQMPSLPTPAERDVAYLGWALDGWAGRSGHDAPMVALEALLTAGGSWEDLCARGVLHGGDNDSTGTIAAGCWGLRWGLTSIPPGLHCRLEHRGRLRDAAHRLHALAWGRH
ncbi:ADP-ribosylhydrolase ARH1 isoform X2 [Cuculus canorus]|uniref:ADP-ribosylhydrolase ARH1 isoform X2 n=1 Tax=Cuculus canorus TaxID=55661 RepID=UPI0023AAE751|nr:ADP-ribosylhydrolase ARH1 isoform X2 [Cuculus canorus]